MSLSSALDLPVFATEDGPSKKYESVADGYDFDSSSGPLPFFFFPVLNILSLLVCMWGFALGELDDGFGGEDP